jgi:hypothetical protein
MAIQQVRVTFDHLEILSDLAVNTGKQAARVEAKEPGKASSMYEVAAWLFREVARMKGEIVSGQEVVIPCSEDDLSALAEVSGIRKEVMQQRGNPTKITVKAETAPVLGEYFSSVRQGQSAREKAEAERRSATERARAADNEARRSRLIQAGVLPVDQEQ